jgi:elongation factor G
MNIYIKNSPCSFISYDKIQEAFANFQFERNSYTGEGLVKKQTSGRCLYGGVKIIIEENKNENVSFQWLVTEDQIPILYLDAILSTIKFIISKSAVRSSLNIRIVDGKYHPVDSCEMSFEIATFRAIADLIGMPLIHGLTK